jgi:hypothetical protein
MRPDGIASTGTPESDRLAGVLALEDCAYVRGARDDASEPSAQRVEAEAVTAARNTAARLDGWQAVQHRPALNAYVRRWGRGTGCRRSGRWGARAEHPPCRRDSRPRDTSYGSVDGRHSAARCRASSWTLFAAHGLRRPSQTELSGLGGSGAHIVTPVPYTLRHARHAPRLRLSLDGHAVPVDERAGDRGADHQHDRQQAERGLPPAGRRDGLPHRDRRQHRSGDAREVHHAGDAPGAMSIGSVQKEAAERPSKPVAMD